MKKLVLLVGLSTFLFSASCKKDKTVTPEDPVTNPPATESGALSLEFNNLVGTAPLVFGTNYVTANNDTFRVNKFLYYISNLVLVKNDNTEYALPNSYYLINHAKAGSNVISLSGIPLGDYKAAKFMLGVDSTRNVSGAQTGALDPAQSSGMFWSWNTGYIFLMLEGSSPQSGSSNKSLTYHIGGYGGVNKAQRNFNLPFGSTALSITKTASPRLAFNVNVEELFRTPNLINVKTVFNQTSPGATTRQLADNYADMISLKEVKN